MKTVACIIARTNSTRLPKKVLRDINGIKMIEYIIAKIKQARYVDEIYLCTSVDENDKILLDVAKQNGIKALAGSRDSVIDRMLAVAEIEHAENVVRITGDNIFTDEVYLDMMVKYHQQNTPDYTRTEYLPIGIASEVINVDALKRCHKQINPDESQYLMLYMFQPENFKCQVLIPEDKHKKPEMTFTVDTPADFERTLQLASYEKHKLLNLNDLLTICESENIFNSIYKPGGSVRFPANLIFSFKAFRTEMEMRIENSNKVCLKTGEYDNVLKLQQND